MRLEKEGSPRVLREVRICVKPNGHHEVVNADGPSVIFEDSDSLVKCLKFSTVQELRLVSGSSSIDENLLRCLLPVKAAWKDGKVVAAPRSFSSEKAFEFAFSEVLLCKEICLEEYEPRRFTPKPFMRLPAVLHCQKLDVSRLRPWPDALMGLTPYSLHVHEIIEWLEHAAPKKWDEPKQLDISADHLNGHRQVNGFLEALKKAFLAATCPRPYVVRVRILRSVEVKAHLQNNLTKERLNIHVEAGTGALCERVIVVKRQ